MSYKFHDGVYKKFYKKFKRWCERNTEMLVAVSTTSASILVFAFTLKYLSPYVDSFRRKLVVLANIESTKLIQQSEAMRQIGAGKIQSLRYHISRMTGHTSVYMNTLDNQRLKAYVVPGSESNLFSLAALNVPNFEINPTASVIRQMFMQSTFFLLSLFSLWKLSSNLNDISFDNFSPESVSLWERYKDFGSIWSFFFSDQYNKKNKLIHREQEPLTFNDFISPVKNELFEIVDLLNNPEKFHQVGASCPKGILLTGPSGTGKTLLARVVAAEANVQFLSCSASNFVEMYAGKGAGRVRNLFKKARRMAPSVIFIDELDALGTRDTFEAEFSEHKQTFFSTAHDEYVQTLNQVLTEMDGFKGRDDGVLVIGATNRQKAIDSALLRAGRFDRWLHLQLPNNSERYEILRVSIRRRGLNLSQMAMKYLPSIAQRTNGWSGAELDVLINETAFETHRRRQESHSHRADSILTSPDDLDEALNRFSRSRQTKPISYYSQESFT